MGRSSTPAFSDTGLTPSTTYTYRVSAVNGQGLEGSASSPENVRTLDPEPPPPPTNLSATAFSASAIDLAWTASAAGDLIGYRVLRNGTPVVTLGLVTSYRDSGLQGFTTYNYTVTALDSEGLESGPSAPAQATTLDGTPPTTPANLAATATGTTTIALTWSASADPETGIAGYRVYRGGNVIATTTQTSYTEGGLSPATTYSYRVRAVNGQGLESAAEQPGVGDHAGRDGTDHPDEPGGHRDRDDDDRPDVDGLLRPRVGRRGLPHLPGRLTGRPDHADLLH